MCPSLAHYGALQEEVDAVPDTIFADGKPTKPPTLVLPKAAVAFGKGVYSAPPLAPTVCNNMVKNNLYVGPEVHDQLMKNLELEDFLIPYLNHPLYSKLKEFINMSVNYVERSRFADRPRLLSVNQTDETIRCARLNGAKKLSLNFYPEAPSKQVYWPNEVVDHRAHSNTKVLPLLDLPDVL